MTDVIASILKLLEPLQQFGIYLIVDMFAGLAYFTVRWWFEAGPRKSQWTPVLAAFLGMLLHIRPTNSDLIIKYVILSFLQAFIVIAAYSWAEKRGWIDKIGDAIDRKFFSKNEEPKP